jgi:hypothetical protein
LNLERAHGRHTLFGAVLFAVSLHAIAALIQTRLQLGRRLALGVSGAGVAAALAAAGLAEFVRSSAQYWRRSRPS